MQMERKKVIGLSWLEMVQTQNVKYPKQGEGFLREIEHRKQETF